MKILVTGGLGYIGSHTVIELYFRGHDVVILDNLSNSSPKILDQLEKITCKKFVFYKVDCLNMNKLREVFEKEGFNGVIHFAAKKAVGESVLKPLLYYENNLISLINILKLMKVYDIQNLVFSSSCTVYGEPDCFPVTEKTPRKDAKSPYGNTKKISEDIIFDTTKASVIKAVVLRYFNPIGAHSSGLIGELPKGVPNNLVPYIMQSAIGIRGPLQIFGNNFDTPDGYQIRDYIHITDLAKAHVQSIEYLNDKSNGFWDVFNIGTGKGNSVMELIKEFQEISNNALKYEISNPRPGDITKIWADVSKAKSKLNWESKRTLRNSLEDAWKWQQYLQKNKF